jgi:hypothetical protein
MVVAALMAVIKAVTTMVATADEAIDKVVPQLKSNTRQSFDCLFYYTQIAHSTSRFQSSISSAPLTPQATSNEIVSASGNLSAYGGQQQTVGFANGVYSPGFHPGVQARGMLSHSTPVV